MSDDRRSRASAAQHSAVHLTVSPGSVVEIRACPGAGKTRVIVERHLNVPVPARKGRAVVSFTRVAGHEIRQRCLKNGRTELLESPHFVGTLDTFLWRHLVRPYLPRESCDRVWTRLESWGRLSEARRGRVDLDDFAFGFDARTGLHIGPATLRERKAGRGFTEQERRDLQPWAKLTIRRLWGRGYLTGDLLRDTALNHLQNPRLGPRVRAMVAGRFTEMIVDEFQDCSREDRAILHHLSAAGLPLLLVGDPDQSIYGFRDKETRRPELPQPEVTQRRELVHNWRSSQTVCDLAATFRVDDRPADTATGSSSASAPPVLLVPHDRAGEAARVFADEARRYGIPEDRRMLLAYGGADLPTRTGGKRHPRHSSSLGRLLWAVGTLRSRESPAARRAEAAGMLKEYVLDAWGVQSLGTERERLLDGNVEPVDLERKAAKLLLELPGIDDRSTSVWRKEALQVLDAHHLLPASSDRRGSDWRCPQSTAGLPAYRTAGFAAPVVTEDRPVGRVRLIHQVKGEEADAVLVVMPDDAAVSLWASRGRRNLSRDEEETLRVYFVAVTRARRLVALAVPSRNLELAGRVLQRSNVDYAHARGAFRRVAPKPDLLF